jgi:hypothetical protein
MLLLLIPAQKWAGMSPHRIEDGPTWFWASVSALYTMALLFLAMLLHAAGHKNMGSILGSFGFGSAIGACFYTQFRPAPEHVPNPILRWLTSKMDALADGALKAAIVVPIGSIVGRAAGFDGRYWVTVCFALALVLTKSGVAQLSLSDQSLKELCAARRRMLIGGNLWLTVLIGISCLCGWLSMARPIFLKLQAPEMNDYVAVLAIIAGVGLR